MCTGRKLLWSQSDTGGNSSIEVYLIISAKENVYNYIMFILVMSFDSRFLYYQYDICRPRPRPRPRPRLNSTTFNTLCKIYLPTSVSLSSHKFISNFNNFSISSSLHLYSLFIFRLQFPFIPDCSPLLLLRCEHACQDYCHFYSD